MKSILVLLLSLAALVHGEEKWKTYTNARFGFRISHPATLVAEREPDNGGGQAWHTKGKEFQLVVFGHFLLEDQTLDSLYKDELKELGKHVTYKKKGDGWYVVSWVKDGTEFYHKTCVKEGNYASFHATYPHAKAAQYDPWVERIAKSFEPFLKGDYDRIER